MTVFNGDRGLLDDFRQGRRAALTRVYFHYFDQVAVLVRRGFVIEAQGNVHVRGARDPQEERDLIQEVFARAFSEGSRLGYDGLQLYRPYLLRIAKNLLIDLHRRSLSRPEVSLDQCKSNGEAVGDIDDVINNNAPFLKEPERPVEERLHCDRQISATREFIEALPKDQQRLVQLRFEEEHSQNEVADLMGVSRRHVRTLEDRIRKGLRRHLITTRNA